MISELGIGTIESYQGEATVIRAGIEVAVSEGMAFYEGDIVKTGESGNIKMIYIDETVVILGDNGQLVINEVSFDAQKFDINIDSGMFYFTTGEIAELEHDVILIHTPAAQIGIRGTTLVGIVGEKVSIFTLLNDASGKVGAIELSNDFGSLVLSKMGQTSQVLDYSGVIQSPYLMTQGSIDREYFKVLSFVSEQYYKETDYLNNTDFVEIFDYFSTQDIQSYAIEPMFEFVSEPSFVHPHVSPKSTPPAPPVESEIVEEDKDPPEIVEEDKDPPEIVEEDKDPPEIVEEDKDPPEIVEEPSTPPAPPVESEIVEEDKDPPEIVEEDKDPPEIVEEDKGPITFYGNEDTAIALDLSIDNSEILSIVVTDVPEGANLSAGTRNDDGSWTLTTDQLPDLTVTPPLNLDVDFQLSVSVVTLDDVINTAQVIVEQEFINAKIIGTELSDALVKLDRPGMSESGCRTLLKHAETWVSEGLTLPDGLAELIANAVTEYIPPNAYVSLTNFKTAVMLIFDVVNVSWTASKKANAIVDITLDDVTEAKNNVADVVSLNSLDPQWVYNDFLVNESNYRVVVQSMEPFAVGAKLETTDGRFLLVSRDNYSKFIDAYEANILLGHIEAIPVVPSDGNSINVIVEAVADVPTLTVSNASGTEDQPIALDISAALTDTDGSESLSIAISVLVDEVLITEKVTADMADEITAYKNITVSNLKIYYNSNSKYEWVSNDPYFELIGDIDFGWGKNLSDVDGVNVYALMVETRDSIDAVVNEKLETAIAEALQFAENIAGNSSLSAGTENAAGSWTLTAEQLTGLTVTPPTNSDVDFQLSVTATTTEADGGDTATTTGTIDVSVAAVADVPTLVVNDVSTSINQPIPLEIFASLVDLDGSESLSIIISNKYGPPLIAANSPQASGGGIQITSDPIPIFTFEEVDDSVPVGFDLGDGSWILTADELNDLILNLEPNFDDAFDLFVTAISTEIDNGDEASISAIINVSFDGS